MHHLIRTVPALAWRLATTASTSVRTRAAIKRVVDARPAGAAVGVAAVHAVGLALPLHASVAVVATVVSLIAAMVAAVLLIGRVPVVLSVLRVVRIVDRARIWPTCMSIVRVPVVPVPVVSAVMISTVLLLVWAAAQVHLQVL